MLSTVWPQPLHFHYQLSNATWACDLCTFLVGKTRENDKERHNVTQIASLLAVATVFIDIQTPFYSQGGGGGLIHETKLPMQELDDATISQCRACLPMQLCTLPKNIIIQ